MKSYPSIAHKINSEDVIWAFDKLDGSNIRAEWSKKRGFYKFGTRKMMIDEKNRHLGKSVTLIKKLYAEELGKRFLDQKWDRSVVCYFEFYGPHSFSGQHRKIDDHTVTLFDVSVHKEGFVHPNRFIDLFEDLGTPKMLYKGRADQEFVEDVRNFNLPGMTLEGVVCKAPNPKGQKTGKRVCFKVKTQRWLDKLKEECGDDERKFEKLS